MAACGGAAVTPVDDPTVRDVATPVPPLEGPAMKVSLEELEDSLLRYVGYTVQVTGTIQQRLASRMFTLGQNVSLETGGDLIVYAPGTLADTLRDGTIVTVTGTVKTLVLDDLVDPRDSPQERTDIDWTRQPVIVAIAIEWRGTRPAAIMAWRGQPGPRDGCVPMRSAISS
jgi:hypothetical protein